MSPEPPNASDLQRAKTVETSTCQSLIVRIKQNDPPAWRDLIRLYSPLVYYWCQRAGLPQQEIADAVQDVFQAVVSKIADYRHDQPGSTFRGWLRTIARNKVHDHFRRKHKEPTGAGGTDAHLRMESTADVDDELDHEEDDLRAEHELFMRAIEMIRDDFKPQTWRAFWEVVVEGKTANEVADLLEMQPGTVRVAKCRVLQRLREQLGDVLE